MNDANSNIFTKRLKICKFIFAVMVVFIHVINVKPVYDSSSTGQVYQYFTAIVSTFSGGAVPCFFAISGYLFFRGGGVIQKIYSLQNGKEDFFRLLCHM